MAESSSTSRPLPPPFVTIDGLTNVRDIGGYPIYSKPLLASTERPIGHVRSGLIFRGPDATRITETGISQLQHLGITTHFDLRSQQQLDRMGDGPAIEGVRRIWAPVFGESEYTIDKAGERYRQYAGDGTEGIVRAFVEIMTHGAEAFKQIMEHIASLPVVASEHEGTVGAVYINCTTGNNRTGPFIGTLLTFLGVPAEMVAREYALSDIGLAASRAKTVARLRSNSKFAASFSAEELDYRAERMSGAREESMAAFLEELEKKWGGAKGYFKGMLELGDEMLEMVNQVMLVPDVDGARERERRGSVLSNPVSPEELREALSSVM